MNASARSDGLVENVAFKLIARASMAVTPILLVIFGWIAVDYMNSQRDLNRATASEISDLGDAFHGLESRIVALETNSLRGRAERELSQSQVLARIDKLDDRLGVLSSGVAGLTAKVDTLIEQKRADIVPR